MESNNYKEDEENRRLEYLEYSDKQVVAWQRKEDDLIEELRKKGIFSEVARKYGQTMPIADSVVRLDQEAEIAEVLRGNKPVLIRGNGRMGKTSMVLSLANQFGLENSIFIDTEAASTDWDEQLEDFKERFGVPQIARLIAGREFIGRELKDRFEKKDEIRKQIAKSQKPPFEFLNDYLAERGEKVLLFLDEVIGLAEQPEKLKYLADLKNYSNIRLVVVLHRVAALEDLFKEIFAGYETYFIRPLTLEEVGILVRKPLEGTQITFTDEAIQRIFEFTGGRPMEINNVCCALMDEFSAHKNHRLVYRAEDIDGLTRKETRQLRESFRIAIATYERVYNRSLSDEEREIVAKLIRRGKVPISEIDSRKVQPLIDTTFVVEDKGVYQINGELFKRVISELIFK